MYNSTVCSITYYALSCTTCTTVQLQYLRAGVYAVYKGIFTTGAAMALKNPTSTKVPPPIEINVTPLYCVGFRERTNPHYFSRRTAGKVVLERRGFLFAATWPIHTVSALYWRRTESSINPGNALIGCALAADLAPEAAAVSPLTTGDR